MIVVVVPAVHLGEDPLVKLVNWIVDHTEKLPIHPVQAVLVTMDGRTVNPDIVMNVSLVFVTIEEQPTLHAMDVRVTTHQWPQEHFVKPVIGPNVIITDTLMMHAHHVFVTTDIQEINVIHAQNQISLWFQFPVLLEILLTTKMMLSVIAFLLFAMLQLPEIYVSLLSGTCYL